ncbi:hypothetical protein ACWDBO_54085, partial [Streptomyces mirabilis]
MIGSFRTGRTKWLLTWQGESRGNMATSFSPRTSGPVGTPSNVHVSAVGRRSEGDQVGVDAGVRLGVGVLGAEELAG